MPPLSCLLMETHNTLWTASHTWAAQSPVTTAWIKKWGDASVRPRQPTENYSPESRRHSIRLVIKCNVYHILACSTLLKPTFCIIVILGDSSALRCTNWRNHGSPKLSFMANPSKDQEVGQTQANIQGLSQETSQGP